MSINEMILISRICFGGMILFLLLSVLLFFQLNIRKAWEIVSGKYLSGHSGQTVKVPSTKLSTRDMINSGQLQEREKTDLLSSADLRKLLQEEHATKILQEDYATKILQEDHETLILQQEQSTTVTQASDETTVLRYGETVLLAEELAGRNKFDIIVDITYVHTQIVI